MINSAGSNCGYRKRRRAEDKNRVGSFMNMSFTCDDLEKTYQELKKRGVEFENPPKQEPWGKFAIFRDSEGNRFVLGD